ncbi:unnamed protein product [Parnassius apollo]|uniref:(apollo) hypothetical protein n=1 Tax=Parnassius apollo TaxID=110799 RepID=A0A8S3XRN4_PARAO|nr:unnamed protein product [Parnassius apollo]
MAGRSTSELWHHFQKEDSSGKATCNLCKEKLAYKSTTANLKSHLKRKHVSIFTSLLSQSNAQTQQQPRPFPVSHVDNVDIKDPSLPGSSGFIQKRQKKLDSFLHKKINSEQKKQINLDLLDLCTDSFHPFSIVEERAFKKFCRWIPGYQLPTRKTLSKSIMQEAYVKLYDATQTQLRQKVQSICLTADV